MAMRKIYNLQLWESIWIRIVANDPIKVLNREGGQEEAGNEFRVSGILVCFNYESTEEPIFS